MTGSSSRVAPAAFSYPGHGGNARIGVASCHGFTGSPDSVRPWAAHLAAEGFAVSVPLLPGHGTDWRDLARRVRIVGLLKHLRRTTAPVPEENPTASPTDDGDYSVTPLEAVHQLRRLFTVALRELPVHP